VRTRLGLFGAFHFDLVAALLGPFSAISRVVDVLAGLAAIHQAVTFKWMQRRRHGEAATAIR
jgi:uncharacterized membrane protein YuzA (DUF378 family)